LSPDGPPPLHRGTEELGDFTTSDRRLITLSALAVIVGVLGALVAAGLYALIGFFTNLFYFGRLSFTAVPPANTWGLLSVVVPILGGLIIGGMARFGSERIRGHGIPEALESILIDKSRVSPRLALLKPISSAVSIGTGGPFGAEGPIIMTGGALGSVFGQFLRLTASERKTLLVAGAAAGMAAIFNTPLAAVLLSVELLLFEWKPRSLIPVGIASATAAVLSWTLVPAHGAGPLFPIPATPLPSAAVLLGAGLVGLLAGALATLLTWAVYFFEDSFRKLPIHWSWWPAIGGAVVGAGGLILVESLGVGYGGICLLLGCTNPQLTAIEPAVEVTLVFVATLLFVKAVIWAVALGSGTSGGVLAPLLIIGGSLGVVEAHFLPFGSTALWVLVSMSATLGGTMRSPFTGVVFALELTHDVTALAPLLVAAIIADGFTVLSMRRSILTEKVARRGVHVAREYTIDPLERITVGAVMRTTVGPVGSERTVADALQASAEGGQAPEGLELLDAAGLSVGFVARADLERYLSLGGDPTAPVASRAVALSHAAYSDEPMRIAADRLAQIDRFALPVIDPGAPGHVIGFITRETPFDARVHWNRIDQEREQVLTLSLGAAWQAWRRHIRPPKTTPSEDLDSIPTPAQASGERPPSGT
jgi:chloride channel protein, CIC family